MMMTIDDLRNPKRKSGFDYVSSAVDSRPGRTNPLPYQSRSAFGGAKKRHPSSKNGSDFSWRGPRRATPEEAAQDYCDYANGLGIAAPTTLNYPGHAVRPKGPVDSEVQAALGVLRDARAQRRGRQGYVYCIGEKSGGNLGYVKIGYSVNPEARVGELQTGNPRVLYLVAKMPGTEEDERRIHAKFIHKNIVGEWFSATADVLAEFAGHYEWQKRK